MTQRYELKLIRAALFNVTRESDQATTTFLRYVYLERESAEHLHLNAIFKDNIYRKLRGDENKYFGAKGYKKAAVEIVSEKTYSGRRPITNYGKIIREDYKEEYKTALKCTDEKTFRPICAKIANRFAQELRFPKGIICFVQFTFQTSRQAVQPFLAILNTEYKEDIIHYDEYKILEYLSNTFEEDFNYTILFPYILGESAEKIGAAEGVEKEIRLKIDENQLKLHTTDSDELIYSAAGIKKPIDVQEKFVKAYESSSSDHKSMEQVKQVMGEELNLAILDLKIGDLKLKIPAKYFFNSVKAIVTDYGEGFVVKKSEVSIFVGKHDLFSEGKIKKFSPEDLKNVD